MPRYEHNCPDCKYLGSFEEYDFYVHEYPDRTVYIGIYDDLGHYVNGEAGGNLLTIAIAENMHKYLKMIGRWRDNKYTEGGVGDRRFATQRGES